MNCLNGYQVEDKLTSYISMWSDAFICFISFPYIPWKLEINGLTGVDKNRWGPDKVDVYIKIWKKTIIL